MLFNNRVIGGVRRELQYQANFDPEKWSRETRPAARSRAKVMNRHTPLTARILFSLSALAASLLAGVQAPVPYPSHEATPRFLRLVAPFALSVSEHASPALPFAHPSASTLALAALTDTPFRRSLWLVHSQVAIDSIERRHQRKFLRC